MRFRVNQNKSILDPAQIMEFLGLTVNTIEMDWDYQQRRWKDLHGGANNEQMDRNLMQRTITVDRKDDCNNTGDPTRPSVLPQPSDVVIRHAEQQFPELWGYGASDTSMHGRTNLLGHQHDLLEWEIPSEEENRHYNRFGHLLEGVGLNMLRRKNRRSLIAGWKRDPRTECMSFSDQTARQ